MSDKINLYKHKIIDGKCVSCFLGSPKKCYWCYKDTLHNEFSTTKEKGTDLAGNTEYSGLIFLCEKCGNDIDTKGL